MSILYLYQVTVQYFPVLDPNKSVFFSYWMIRCKCTLPFFNDKAIDRKKYPNEKHVIVKALVFKNTLRRVKRLVTVTHLEKCRT